MSCSSWPPLQICEGADEGRWAEHQGGCNGQHIRAHGRQQQHRYTLLTAYLASSWPPASGACQKQRICAVQRYSPAPVAQVE